jgi:N-6 DNA Methylase
LLTVLLRLVFLPYAEDRDLIPSRPDRTARDFYDQGYGVRSLHGRLLEDAARYPDTMDERRGAWGRLLALFRLVHTGDGTGWIRARGGKLFDPAAFPFLQGQAAPEDPPRVPPVSDGAVLRVLGLLLTLDGERLSYRTLDVEQIGSVYETVMGFKVDVLEGPALAIKAGRNNRTPVFVDLADLLKKRGADRLKSLKEDANRQGTLSARQAQPITAADSETALAAALAPLVDDRGSPRAQVRPRGTPLLQPTDERRRTGSHYTPRDLTNPIVEHALAPAFERLGENATPEQVLALKVCDPAMGSGAFLVEACRQIAARLVRAWTLHAGTRPPLADDEDEDLLARRLVAQRCLYGVDKNPMAVDLARLSLWLATLARDHEFTFLDHALKAGDSLVGLTEAQIESLTWTDERQGSLWAGLVRQRRDEARDRRESIRAAADDVTLAEQEAKHRLLETTLEQARTIGDAVIGAFFAGKRMRERLERRNAIFGPLTNDAAWEAMGASAASLRTGEHAVRPLHWEIEFPEVFGAPNPGFDAIIGNPPFAGKNTLINSHREYYLDWLQTLHEGAHGNSDLVAHFFRRAFGLLRPGGCLGLVATNTVGQGDTRQSGLRAVIGAGGSILRVVRRLPWPGEAAVVVSIVHVLRGVARSPVLDGRQVRRVSAYLVEGDLDDSPAPLAANAGKAFVGMYLLGLGFTFDDEAAARGRASPVTEMHRLTAKDSRNAERIFPYLGGEEVNTDPRHAHRRWCIDFNDFPLRRERMTKTWAVMDERERAQCRTRGRVPDDYPDPVAADWPDLLETVDRLVKPERQAKRGSESASPWWQFLRPRPGLRAAVKGMDRLLVRALTSSNFCTFTYLPSGIVYDQTLIVFADQSVATWAVLSSGLHEVWTREFGSSLKDDSRYNVAECFDNFPCPESITVPCLAEPAQAYYDHRAAGMVARNEGLTKTYNRFHDPAERSPDIKRMRELHHAMDVAVLRAYGWDDLADTAAPEFLTATTEPDHRYEDRLFWPAPFRDEVLARLLALNAERSAQERAAGLAPSRHAMAADELEDVE